MCGVCGIAALLPDREGLLDPARVSRMVEALAHRGPDDEGNARSGGALFGATRLAIRGLSGGKQPLLDPGTGVVAVVNGEIDNSAELKDWLRQRGRPVADPTDVAVVPGLYLERGEDCVQDLVGAFALALWDPRRRMLLLARDRAGERPLFYRVEDGVVRFATEISALAEAGGKLSLDREALAQYLRTGCFVSPRTPFREVRKVPPAGLVRFEGGEILARRYWRWSPSPANRRTPDAAAFDRVFRRAVERQSEADVEYGVFLSGGIDSSLVAAVARAVRPGIRLRAYTLRFSEASYDEGSFAGRVAALLGCEQVPVWVEPEDLPREITSLVRMVGEPLADPAWVPTALLARRAAEDVKLALVGEGADELFGGYPTYLGAHAAAAYARMPAPLRRLIRQVVESWPPSDRKVTVSYLLKRFVAGAELDGLSRHLLWTSNIPAPVLRRLGVEPDTAPIGPGKPGCGVEGPGYEVAARGVEGPGSGYAPSSEVEEAGLDLLDQIQRLDLETSLAEGLLTKADRASMRSALELRAPFLDREVMEFAASLPPSARIRRLTTKVFLKEYAAIHLPREIIHRRKRGLSVPLSRWLRGPLRPWAEERLSEGTLARAGVDGTAALALLDEHCRRKADHARPLWALLVLNEWLRWVEEEPGRGALPPLP